MLQPLTVLTETGSNLEDILLSPPGPAGRGPHSFIHRFLQFSPDFPLVESSFHAILSCDSRLCQMVVASFR